MKLKKLSTKNVNDILRLHERSIFPLWRKVGHPIDLKRLKIDIVEDIVKGEIFGYFVGKELAAALSLVINKSKKVGYVSFILVDQKHQREGIGRQLMDFAEDYFKKKKLKKIRLNVLTENKAVGFYEKLRYKKEYHIMEKELR